MANSDGLAEFRRALRGMLDLDPLDGDEAPASLRYYEQMRLDYYDNLERWHSGVERM